MPRLILPISLLSLCLAGCANRAGGGYPTLLPRPIEASGTSLVDEPMQAPVALAASDPARLRAVQNSLEKAQSTIGPFQTAIGAARGLANQAYGSGSGTEAWVAAQVAVGRADSARGQTATALAELDEQMRLILAGPKSADEAAVLGAIQQVEGIDRAQQAEMNAVMRLLER